MSVIVGVHQVAKQYGALRPLRIEELEIEPGEQIALLGLDQPAAEAFINLLTGASLPDAGTVTLFGRTTAAIGDSADWLSTLDRFGIVSERAPLLEPLSVVQNLVMPFTLEIEPPAPEVRGQAERLAQAAKLSAEAWDRPVADLDPISRLRVRVARALALDPSVLLLEHPSATLPRDTVNAVARDVRDAAKARGLATLTLTMDRDFARAVADRVLTHEPASGRLTPLRVGRIGFW